MSSDFFQRKQRGQMTQTKVRDQDCFSRCEWLEGMVRCRNCPYIGLHGEVADPRVKGRWNIFEN